MSTTPSTPTLIDQESLNDAERELLAIFERRSTGSASQPADPSLTSAEDEPDTTGTPGSSTSTSAAPEPSSPVEGQEIGSESVPSPEPTPTPTPDSTPPATPTEGEPPASEPVQSDAAFTFAGVDYNDAQLARAVQVHNWYDNLNDQQIRAIDALLSGQYDLVPAHSAAPVSPSSSAPSTATSPASSSATPTSEPTPVGDDAGEWLDPRAEAEITRLRSELQSFRDQFTSSISPLVQSQQDAQLAQHTQVIDTAANAFRDQYSLTPETLEAVTGAVVQAGILPSLLHQHNNNLEAATRQALELIFWSTPTFRDEYVKSTATAQATSPAEADRVRQEKLTALNSTGGSVPRREMVPSTKQDRHAAMVEAIRADMNGS